MKITNNFKILSVALVVLIVLFFGMRGKTIYKKFNSDLWKNADLKLEKNWSIRWDMMNSLRNENDIIGKSYEEIIQILGNPDNETENELLYNLGYTGNGINTGNLIIILDKNKKVTNLKVHEG